MNTALKNIENEDLLRVQSEKDIWWLAAFELPKESHEILQWIFNKTDIPEIIARQNSGLSS